MEVGFGPRHMFRKTIQASHYLISWHTCRGAPGTRGHVAYNQRPHVYHQALRPHFSHRLCTRYATIGHHIVSCHHTRIGQGRNARRRQYETHPNCLDLYHFQEGHGIERWKKNWICFIIESFNLVVTSPLVIISNHMCKFLLPAF